MRFIQGPFFVFGLLSLIATIRTITLTYLNYLSSLEGFSVALIGIWLTTLNVKAILHVGERDD